MENKSKISERLKELRNKKGMTQEELAQNINTSRSNIANYETGKNNPSVEMLEKLSEIFNCSMDYLMGRTDLKTTKEYLDGFYDGEKKWQNKINNKIKKTR